MQPFPSREYNLLLAVCGLESRSEARAELDTLI
jgi:hypothetical protein